MKTAFDPNLKVEDPHPGPPPEYQGRRKEEHPGRVRNGILGGLLRSFGFAFAGVWYMARTQRNVRIEISVGVAVCLLGGWLGISREDWAILALTVAMVLMGEALNTAIEAAVDLAMPEWHRKAKICKDVAAGMVLVGAMASVVVGVLIFGPALWHRLVG